MRIERQPAGPVIKVFPPDLLSWANWQGVFWSKTPRQQLVFQWSADHSSNTLKRNDFSDASGTVQLLGATFHKVSHRDRYRPVAAMGSQVLMGNFDRHDRKDLMTF
ncbi:hypothetical protein CPT32_30830 [Rhizobium sophoriradicis]|nr:hypothetical protein CPT32_30830 [Rhizobium sophoriradicis]PDS73626.1 hypothetical protein CO667_32205 [Rhizobium sp. L43]